MLLGNSTSKGTSPMLALVVGTLAMVGAFSIVRCGKKAVRCTCDRMTGMVKGVMGTTECQVHE